MTLYETHELLAKEFFSFFSQRKFSNLKRAVAHFFKGCLLMESNSSYIYAPKLMRDDGAFTKRTFSVC